MTVIHVGQAPRTFEAEADVFDGRSAERRRTIVRIREGAEPALSWVGADAIARDVPLTTLRAVPDQSDRDLILTSTDVPTARLHLLDPADRAVLTDRLGRIPTRQPQRGVGRIAAWAVAALASVAVIVFLLVPLLADQMARVLPPGGEQALGDATFEQIRTFLDEDEGLGLHVCDSSDGRAALDRMAERLGAGDLDLPYPLRVDVVDHPMENAFALPGGRIVFFDGLLQLAEHPDEIAAVLAHEIGHVDARDPTRIALRSAGSIGILGLILGDFAGGAVVLFLVEQIIRADYTREAEAQADDYAIAMLAEARVDAGALGDLFERLIGEDGDDGGGGLAEHFMSHPALGDRIAAAREAALPDAQTTPSLDAADWSALRNICR